jgi:hypothetical protein
MNIHLSLAPFQDSVVGVAPTSCSMINDDTILTSSCERATQYTLVCHANDGDVSLVCPPSGFFPAISTTSNQASASESIRP